MSRVELSSPNAHLGALQHLPEATIQSPSPHQAMCCGSCVGSCIGACACTCCSTLSKKLCGANGSLLPYLILLLITTVLAIILRYESGSLFSSWYSFNSSICDSERCIGYSAVYRISFSLVLFYFLHSFCLLFKPCYRLDTVNWLIQYLFYVGLLILSFLIPQAFYDNFFVHAARIVSGLFLFFQIVILIDFAYSWNENWTSEDKGWYTPVLIISFLFFCGSIVLIAFYFIWFAGSGCDRNNFFIAWTLIMAIIYTLISISPKIEQGGGLLPSAVVTLYCIWLCYSALSSDPSSCNSIQSNDTLHLILGLALGTLSIAYTGWNTATNNSLFGGEEAKPNLNDIETQKETEKPKGSEGVDSSAAASPIDSQQVEENDRKLAKRNFRFHLLMLCCAFYMAMLLTNW
jgi:hypothetical protein